MRYRSLSTLRQSGVSQNNGKMMLSSLPPFPNYSQKKEGRNWRLTSFSTPQLVPEYSLKFIIQIIILLIIFLWFPILARVSPIAYNILLALATCSRLIMFWPQSLACFVLLEHTMLFLNLHLFYLAHLPGAPSVARSSLVTSSECPSLLMPQGFIPACNLPYLPVS